MFGFVMANLPELEHPLQKRYNAVYCGVCRRMCQANGTLSRFGLQYDMAFLALLLMSLYEPAEETGHRACKFHPIKPRAWIDNDYIAYSGDMNIALAYYKAKDDKQDENKLLAGKAVSIFGKAMAPIQTRYPRQCKAMETCMAELTKLEQEKCENPDMPANCFGTLLAELLVYQEDMWAPLLRNMGMALGRFIYFADAAVDYKQDKKSGNYNPFLASSGTLDIHQWESYLAMEMGKATRYYESLPLVQDKAILDNILYSGIWLELRRKRIDRSL